MLEQLSAFLETSVTPEYAGLLMKSATVLYEMGVRTHESDLIQNLAIREQEGRDQTVMVIGQVINNGLDYVIESHGIYTSTGDLTAKLGLVEALQRLQNWDDTEAIMAICNSEETVVEKLCELFELTTAPEQSAEDFHEIIKDADERVILGLIDMYEEDEAQAEERLTPIVEAIRNRILRLVKLMPNTLAVRLVDEKIPLGAPVQVYLNYLDDELIERIRGDMDMAAREILGLVLISDTLPDQVRLVIAHLFDDYLPSIDRITEADQFLDKHLTEIFAP